MDDLIAWLRQQLDDDERAARAVPVNEHCVPPAHWSVSTYDPDKGRVVMGTADDFALPTPEHAQYVARFDPAAVLADIAAKRAVLLVCSASLVSTVPTSSFVRGQDDGYREAMTEAVRYLASAYRHRPGWKNEWEA
ncbi:DUF6221 family protein [Nocardiopsis synnemataformans]|uniref:DUF6221 family protein n=1 Tax=Nocardiopsis synnemataformans TaxID=61305 RepID=UPI003EB9F029